MELEQVEVSELEAAEIVAVLAMQPTIAALLFLAFGDPRPQDFGAELLSDGDDR